MRERDFLSLDFPRIKEILASFTTTPFGREKALALSPFATREEAEREISHLLCLGDTSIQLFGVKDIRKVLVSLKEGMALSPEELLDIRSTICGWRELKRLPEAILPQPQGLSLLRAALDLAAEISEVIDKGGGIKVEKFPILKRLVEEVKDLRGLIIKKLVAVKKENQHLFWEGEITLRNGRYCLPLKSEHKRKVPSIVHDLSESEKTVFIEPLPLVELGNQLISAEKRIEEEKKRILLELTKEVFQKRDILLSLADLVGTVDLWQAKREFSRRFGGTRPYFTTENYLEVIGARHPLLLLQDKEVVPLDLKMAEKKVLVVSGPNAGGKTCLLKTIGIISLLSQSGIFPPCQRAVIPFFDNIFTDIGESESLEESVSAFTYHLLNLKEILEKNNRGKNLILLDEVGNATSPEEGGALAIALLEKLKETDGFSIITTHLTTVKTFAYKHPEILLGSMEFRERPTYRLILNQFGDSSALEIASLLGFPEEIIQRARVLKGEKFTSLLTKIKELEAEAKSYRVLNQELAEREKEVTEMTSLLEKRLRELSKKEKEMRQAIIREKEAFFRENREKVEKVFAELRRQSETQERKKKTEREIEKEVRGLFESWEEEIKEERKSLITESEAGRKSLRREVKVGDLVYIPRFAQKGEVLERNEKAARVRMGNIFLTMPVGELEVILSEGKEETKKPIALARRCEKDEQDATFCRGSNLQEPTPTFSPLLNIRGEEMVFALEKVTKFLEDALFYGVKEVKLLHGKGKWILRNAIWQFLENDKRILEFREGNAEEGGSGITVVRLK